MPKPGGTVARGYNSQHKAVRRTMKQQVDAGLAVCSICGGGINPTDPWDADHTDDRTGYRGPAHRHCNRRAGAIKGNTGRQTLKRWRL